MSALENGRLEDKAYFCIKTYDLGWFMRALLRWAECCVDELTVLCVRRRRR
jgi:hypothetical protein